jgi:hypothetical protein
VRVSNDGTYFVGDVEWGFSVWAHNACLAPLQQLNQSANGARASLRRAIGGVLPQTQTHHLIPWELRTHPFVIWAARGGFGINSKANGVLLSIMTHLGSHSKFNAAVLAKVDQLATLALTSGQAAAALNAYASQLRIGLLRTSARLHVTVHPAGSSFGHGVPARWARTASCK